jgi:hypothetical protein
LKVMKLPKFFLNSINWKIPIARKTNITATPSQILMNNL